MFDSPIFEEIRSAVLAAAFLSGGERVLDLGAGSGFLSLAIAPHVGEIVAVDISDAMLDRLQADAHDAGLVNVEVQVADLAVLNCPANSVDVIVSNYALHHLTDVDKSALVARAHEWLRPGGRIIIADMMFGRGGTARDRQILREKIARLMCKGPGGVWRIVKNLVRFGLRRGTELPAPPQFWTETLTAGGFQSVHYRPIAAEAGLVTATAMKINQRADGGQEG
ncbi:MAG: class I SAM-dependent methyltransferase [Actinomycetota bacterium]|nr:class I SAM-dependent methyltransferase [Actinomycetota bacterium]